MREFVADSSNRLDRFLAEACPSQSRSAIAAHIHGGAVRLNGSVCRKPGVCLRKGDRVVFSPSPPPPPSPPPRREFLHLYEDDRCVVIEKPSGLASQPAPSLRGTLALTDLLPGLLLVHRLDRGTSGCLLLARDRQALSLLQRQFQDRTVRKSYLAIVAGVPAPRAASIDAPLGRSLLTRVPMALFATRRARAAQTIYETVRSSEGASLLSCQTTTGRTHQVRVHLAAVGHPLLGDFTYGSAASQRLAEQHDITRLCLHACSLTFTSLTMGSPVTITSPLPPDLQGYCARLGLG